MRIALLGNGKTGSKISEIATNHQITVFNSRNTPTLEKLQGHDVVISFLPGKAMEGYVDLLLQAELPVVSGSTGMQWPENINEVLKSKNLAWITASNFAIGMNLIKPMIKILAQGTKVIPDSTYHLHAVHHVNKIDSPSGTAITWKKWLNRDVTFSDKREGDVVGIHQLTLESIFENISIRHEAKNRQVFAQGALWTAGFLLNNNLESGLHQLSDVFEKSINIS